MEKSKSKYPETLGIVIAKVSQSLKRNRKIVISIFIGIVLPWILSLIFVIALDRTHGLSDELTEDAGLLFRIIIFYTFTLTYDLPVLGKGFWLCIFIWAATGLFIGLISQKMGKSLIAALIGLGVNFILYLVLIPVPYTSFPDDMDIDTLIFTKVYSEFVLATPYYLLFLILFHSFAFPILMLFTLLGILFNPPRRTRVTPSEVLPEKIKSEAISEPKVKAEPVTDIATKEEKKLRGFAGIVYNQFQPLNANEEFKEKFKKTSLKILLNPIDESTAALVIMDKGTFNVQEYKKFDPLMKMDKKKIGFDALLQVPTEMMFDIAMGKISTMQLLKATRKDKDIIVKGKLKLLKLTKALGLLAKS
ncbi:MAG: hypothetical protein ACFE8A_01635 [Candidatus Hodarchaeota archaeon]